MKKRGNIQNLTPWTSEHQPTPEAKSAGKLRSSQRRNLMAHLRTRLEEEGIVDKLVDNVKEQLDAGLTKAAIELLKVAKPNEIQEHHIQGAIAQVKKVFITKSDEAEVEQHIKKIIDQQ